MKIGKSVVGSAIIILGAVVGILGHTEAGYSMIVIGAGLLGIGIAHKLDRLAK